MKEIDILLETEGDKLPLYATQGAAGFDLTSNEDVTIKRYDTKLIKTGLKAVIPEGYMLQICSRSGLALKQQVFVLNAPGIIDSDYRGDIGVIITNAGHEDFVIKKGDRIAQGIITQVYKANFKQIGDIDEYSTARAAGGFGSTGTS